MDKLEPNAANSSICAKKNDGNTQGQCSGIISGWSARYSKKGKDPLQGILSAVTADACTTKTANNKPSKKLHILLNTKLLFFLSVCTRYYH